MITKTITVKVKGVGEKPGSKRVFQTQADLLSVPLEEALKLVNYAEDLKVRARVRASNVDTAALTKQRDAAKMLIMKRAFSEPKDPSFLAQYTEINNRDRKAANQWLDDLYAEETEECDEVAGYTTKAS